MKKDLVISYLTLRKSIGFIGIGLPIILVIGVVYLENYSIAFQDSISHYYYTKMRNIYVGALFSVGVFLLSYKGYDWIDNSLSSLAGIFAFGTAVFPTSESALDLVGILHYICAALFLILLSCFSLFLFTKTDVINPGFQKIRRNRIYKFCGILMILAIILIPIYSIYLEAIFGDLNMTFWLESIALWSFGFSWLTKGEALFSDSKGGVEYALQ
jgi:hypothetical protein